MPTLKTWEDLNKYADLFVVAETTPKGRIVGAEVGWGYLNERIGVFDLDYKVVYGGSEAGMLAELSAAYVKGEPIMLYSYAPHFMQRKFDLVVIPFDPPYYKGCYDEVAGDARYQCGYSFQALEIGGWVGLDKKFPEVHQFFVNYKLSNADLSEMLLAFDDGASFDEATQAWMDRNQDVWMAWIP